MSKKITVIIPILLISLLVPAVFAGKAGKSGNFQLLLENKSIDAEGNWNIIEDETFGHMTLKLDSDMFIFNGHGLEVGKTYYLINWIESWPSLKVLGSGVVDECGNVHIMGELTNLEMVEYTSGEYKDNTGAKIWLLPEAFVNADSNVVVGAPWSAVNTPNCLWDTELVTDA